MNLILGFLIDVVLNPLSLGVYLLIGIILSRLNGCSASDDAVVDYCLNLIFRLDSLDTVSVNYQFHSSVSNSILHLAQSTCVSLL